MYKIKIITIGKAKESWLQEALAEYHKRLKNHIQIDWILCKTTEQFVQLLEKESNWIALDPFGETYPSERFSEFLFERLEKEGSRLTFIIGGAEGIPQSIKQQSQSLLSLSSMTFTHQITRLILAEQIYRAFEIHKGSSYHK